MQIRPILRTGDKRSYRTHPRQNSQRQERESFKDVYNNIELDEAEVEKVVVKEDGTYDLRNTNIGLGR